MAGNQKLSQWKVSQHLFNNLKDHESANMAWVVVVRGPGYVGGGLPAQEVLAAGRKCLWTMHWIHTNSKRIAHYSYKNAGGKQVNGNFPSSLSYYYNTQQPVYISTDASLRRAFTKPSAAKKLITTRVI